MNACFASGFIVYSTGCACLQLLHALLRLQALSTHRHWQNTADLPAPQFSQRTPCSSNFPPRYAPERGVEQPLFVYPEGFAAVSCTRGGEYYNVSFNQAFTPEGTQSYAAHLSSLTPYPNNITGTDCTENARLV